MLRYTVIDHEKRRNLGLSWTEYGLADMIDKLSTNRSNEIGWCYMSREAMAKELGTSKRTVLTMIEKLVDMELIEKHPGTKNLRSTIRWGALSFIDGEKIAPSVQKEIFKETAQKLHPDSAKTSPDTVKNLRSEGAKTSPNNNTDKNSNNNSDKGGKPRSINLIREPFEKIYNEVTGQVYYWTAKDAGAAKQLMTKIEFQAKQHKKVVTDETYGASVQWMVDHADKWVKENLSMAILNSKFNEILNFSSNAGNQSARINEALKFVD